MADRPQLHWPSVRSYRDFKRAVRGRTASELRDLYNREYYEKHVGNAELGELYFQGKGLVPTQYTRRPLELAGLRAGERVLDVGAGRGEIVFQAAAAGATATGIDFSESAVAISRATQQELPEDLRLRTTLVLGDAQSLPFPDSAFDVVFLLDVAEHLAPRELGRVLREVRRVLGPQGRAIVHTTPNRWTRTYGWWLKMAALRLAGRPVPLHPLVEQMAALGADDSYDSQFCFLHINEQTLLGLKLALARAGFRSSVWVDETGNRWRSRRDLRGRAASAAYRLLGLRHLFGWDIFAVARPRSRR